VFNVVEGGWQWAKGGKQRAKFEIQSNNPRGFASFLCISF
jgi:hypothetical protein